MFELLAAGWCRHPECSLMRGGSWRSLALPAGVAVIRHPQLGIGLFDTGYSQRFLDATQTFPERIYRWVTPPILPTGSTAKAQLASRGIAADEVKWIVLSHLHADHIAGVLDFPNARIYLHGQALDVMKGRGRWANLLHGTLPSLMPSDLDARTIVVQSADFKTKVFPHWYGFDICGDGSLVIIPLPGHAAGQIGLFIRQDHADPIFLVADAAWTTSAIMQRISPPSYATLIFESVSQAHNTLMALHCLAHDQPHVRLIPSHCPTAWPQLPKT